jgi:hypothetical protein
MTPHTTDSAIKNFERTLERFAQDTRSSEPFDTLAAMLAPGLFKGQQAFFDHACEHAAKARGGALLPALLLFMDKLTSSGAMAPEPGQQACEWRSAALLVDIYTEVDGDDPAILSGLDPLRSALACLHGVDPSCISVGPLALDLRLARAGFDMFRFAMLPTQMGEIDMDELARANPTRAQSPSRFSPWRALCYSCAFEPGKAPADLAADASAALADTPLELPVGYASSEGEAREARLVSRMARGPFSACSMAFEPERAELSADIARIARAYDGKASTLRAIIEPQSSARALSTWGAGDAPIESFALSICDHDGVILDALELPAEPECLALAHALLSDAAIPVTIAPPTPTLHGPAGERLWASSAGHCAFDIFAWRARVLGVSDLD